MQTHTVFLLILLLGSMAVIVRQRYLLKSLPKQKDDFSGDDIIRDAFAGLNIPILFFRGKQLVQYNQKAAEMLALQLGITGGKTMKDMSPEIQQDGISSEEKWDAITKLTPSGNACKFEWTFITGDGSSILTENSGGVFESGGQVYFVVFTAGFGLPGGEDQKGDKKRLELLIEEKTRSVEIKNLELQTLNEELDVANEEMTATNEELNALNEELSKANDSLLNEIEEHKRTQGELEKYKLRLENLLESKTERLSEVSYRFNEIYIHSSDAITFVDIVNNGNTLKVFDMNPTAQMLFRITPEHIAKGVDANAFIPKEKYDSFVQWILPRLLKGEHVNFTEERDTGNGYWNSSMHPIRNKKGEIYRMVAFSRNVTAQHEKERMSDILQSAIDSWPFEFWAYDLEGKLILQNRISLQTYGSKIGKDVDEILVLDEKKEEPLSYIKRVIQGESLSLEVSRFIEGEKQYLEYKMSPIVSKNKIIGYTGLLINNTGRKKIENELRVSENKYHRLFTSMTDGFFRCNMQGYMPEVNNAFLEMTGYSLDEFSRMHYTEITPSKWYAVEEKITQEQLFPRGYTDVYEKELRRKDNTVFPVEMRVYLLKNEQGENEGVWGIVRDISQRKHNEEALRISMDRFRHIARLSCNMVYDYNLDSGVIQWDGAIEEVTGYSVKEYQQVNFDGRAAMIHPDDRENALTAFQEALDNKKPYRAKYRYRNKSGAYRWIEEDSHIILSESGRAEKYLGAMQDVTERKMYEEKLNFSEGMYRLLADNVNDVIWKVDLHSLQCTYCSPSIRKMAGYRVEEVQEAYIRDFLEEHSFNKLTSLLPGWIDEVKNNEANAAFRMIELQVKKKNGDSVWNEVSIAFITDALGGMKELIAVLRNIEERKATETALRESEEKFRTIFNSSKDGIILFNKELQVIDVNNAVQVWTGYKIDDLINSPVYELVWEEGASSFRQYLDSVMQNLRIGIHETRVRKKNGKYFPAEGNAILTQINGEDVMLLIVRDISERKKLERELLNSVIRTEEQNRLYFSQELHDGLGPLLSAAKMYIEWLADPKSNADPATIVPEIHNLLDESNEVVRDISFMLSPHILQNYGITEALKAYADKVSRLGHTVIHIDVADIGRFDEILEASTYRILCECINNTLKHAHAGHINIQLTSGDNMLIINYSDDGKGFDAEKVLEQNKGIGLLNLQSRLKSLNGSLKITSAEGKGTEFFIKIPLS